MRQAWAPAFLPQTPERNHQLEGTPDQGADAEPDGLAHVGRGKVVAEDPETDDHAKVEHA